MCLECCYESVSFSAFFFRKQHRNYVGILPILFFRRFHFISVFIFFFLLSQRKALVARLFRSHVLPTHLQSDSRSRPHKVEKSNNNNDRAKAFSVIRFFPNRMNKYQWKSIYVSLSAWSKATPFHLRFNLLVSLFWFAFFFLPPDSRLHKAHTKL